MAGVKLIVGLGNPGEEYDLSPHNFGFMVVDRLAGRFGVQVSRKQHKSLCAKVELGDSSGGEVWLIKPQTFMNLSGASVQEWLSKQECQPQDLVVIADELDLPWGSIRIRLQGSAAGHNGLKSIIGSIGSQQFVRVRIGVRLEHPFADTVDYLLSPMKKAMRAEMDEIAGRAADAVEAILKEGPTKAMNQFNKRATNESPRQEE
jgi:PTH1 family peptidyl-tRNA hydrolase